MSSAGRTMSVASARQAIAGVPEHLRHLGDWWLKEFFGLFPERIAEFLSGGREKRLVVAVEGESATLQLLGRDWEVTASQAVSHPENTAAEIETFLHRHGLERKAVQMGLMLPRERVFRRHLLIPAEASRALNTITAQDLARKTPFRAADVFSDFAIGERIAGKMSVSQWVARRADVYNAMATLRIPLEELSFISFGEANGSEDRPLIRLDRTAELGSSWLRKAAFALCCVGVLLMSIACGLKYWNQQIALDRLEAEIAAMKKKAQQVRGLVDQLHEKKLVLLRLRMQRHDVPRVIDIWDEVTKILPSHSWLNELKLAETPSGRETQMNLSGFSNAAAGLVGIIARSPMFVEAALSAPVALDVAEGRERFALQARIRRPDLLNGGAR